MTPQGRQVVASLLAEHLRAGATIAVTDGSARASAPATITQDGTTVVASATFGEREANFAWTARALVDGDGLVLDEFENDMGTKSLGAVWTLEIPVEVPDA